MRRNPSSLLLILSVFLLLATLSPRLAPLLESASAAETNASPQGTAFAFEQITVSASPIGFTNATISPNGAPSAKSAFCTVEAQPIRYRLSGAPTSSIGHPAAAGYEFTTVGINNLLAFRAIKSGATDATLTCTYFR